jgi:hypothetical protein
VSRDFIIHHPPLIAEALGTPSSTIILGSMSYDTLMRLFGDQKYDLNRIDDIKKRYFHLSAEVVIRMRMINDKHCK